MASPSSPTPPGNPGGQFSRSTVFPLLSDPSRLGSKGHLIPGAITVLATAALFAASYSKDFFTFTAAFAYYVTFIQCFVVYLLCGRRHLWLPMIVVFVIAYGLMSTPLFYLIAPIFRFALATSLQESADFIPRFAGFFFTAGLLEELYKALPLLAFAAFALYRNRQASAVTPPGSVILSEPLDGIALGVAAGAAFALVETLQEYMLKKMGMGEIVELLKTDPQLAQLKFTMAQGAGLQLLIARLTSQIAGHLAWSGYFGYFIGLAVLRPRSAPLLILTGLGSVAFLHAAWDAAADTPAASIAVGILSYGCLIAAILKARRISPNRDQNFATVIMPYAAPDPVQAPQQPQVSPRTPQPGVAVTPAKPQAPAKLILMIGPVALKLSSGVSIEPQLLGSAGAGRGKQPIADITSNPRDATMLGLRNLSDRTYRAKLIGGKTVEVTNGQSVLLAPGIVIDFGGIEGVVHAG